MTVHPQAVAHPVGEVLEGRPVARVYDHSASGRVDRLEGDAGPRRFERRGLGLVYDLEHLLHLVGGLAEDEGARDVGLILFN